MEYILEESHNHPNVKPTVCLPVECECFYTHFTLTLHFFKLLLYGIIVPNE